MIIRDIVNIDNNVFIFTKSDLNLIIQKYNTNEKYKEAFDTLESNFEYTETEMPVEQNEILNI